MKRRVLILGVVALVCAGGAVMLVQKWLASERVALASKNKAAQQEPTMVLVAGAALASGQFIKADQLKWQSWPDANVQPTYIVKSKANIKEFDGAVVRQGIPAGQPVTKDMVVQPGDRGFLAAVLNPGMRAKTVAVDATTGLAGFVFPGDRVDLILSHRVNARQVANGEPPESHQVSETILTEVRVIGIDQTVSDQKGKPQVAKNVTFELTPDQVEIISVAQNLGKLSLSLRSLSKKDGDPDDHPTLTSTGVVEPVTPTRGVTYTRDTQVSRALKFTDSGPMIEVIRGKDFHRESVRNRGIVDATTRVRTAARPADPVQTANDPAPQTAEPATGEE